METSTIKVNTGKGKLSKFFRLKNRSFKVMLIFIMLLSMTNAIAQNNAKSKYRITAYQKGKNEVVSLSNEVEIIPAATFYIPSAFTPNGDGLNETFGPKGEGITEFNMQVFDRWGNLIFESNNLKIQWDGYHHEEKAPTGTYVYKITAKGQGYNGGSQKLINETGTVTLVL